MTQKVHPSFNRTLRNRELGQALARGSRFDSAISASGVRLVEDSEGDLPTGPLGTFSESSSATSLSVTIGPGEAFVDGRYLATDESFSVSLPSSATTTVFLGARDGSADSIIVDESTVFGSDDVRTPLFDFQTDSSGVQSVTDRRLLGTDIIEIPSLDADSVDAGTVVTTDLSVNGSVNGSLSVGNTVSADTVDVTDVVTGTVDANQIGTAASPPNAEISDLTVNGAVNGSLSVGNTVSADTVDVTNVDADQLGKSTSPPNAEISDLTVNGSVNGIRELIVVQSESNLPAVDPPQIAFVQNKNEYQRSVNARGFDIASATFQKSLNLSNPFPTGLAFNNDGSRLFVVDDSNTEVIQFSLTTNFDIGTASQQKTFQLSRPRGIVFNDDGSRMFIADEGNDEVIQFSLGTNFDVGSVSQQKTFSTQTAGIEGIAFNNSGTRLFSAHRTSPPVINQFSLDTPFDVGFGTLKETIDAQTGVLSDITFNDDGTRLFELSSGADLILESELRVPFNIETAAFVRSISTQDGASTGITFGKTGDRLYETGSNADKVFQSDVSGSPEFVSF